ncbi:MAG TPA: FtsW/RodA/SpoVE family cell cycle protein, partial [Candidatus Paceibacterota bacterium]|nr:FtsW/RodA/SpoVE family cell cycle protein [Candidatus Paceibacterota bacterium]
YFIKQIFLVGTGIVVMSFFSFFNYRYLKNYSLLVFFFYILALGLLATPFLFHSIRGVKSWIVIAGFTVEPVELMKLVLVVLMAKYFSQRHALINDWRHVAAASAYCLVPAVITLAQPDLGSAMIIFCIWLGMLLAAGINKKHLAIIVALAVCAAVAGWFFVLKPYQKTRVVSFLNPASDPRGSGYNLIQSKIAIGAGHWFGGGWGNGTQTKNGFLPEPYNDFVFAATADQFGLVGLTIILGAVMFIISRILVVGEMASSNFGKLFALGVTIIIIAHAFIGASVNVGLMPVTGIPFPFLSYGGSNLMLLMAGVGIVQSIKRYG